MTKAINIAEVVLGAALILSIATRYAALASFVWVLVQPQLRIATGHIQRRNGWLNWAQLVVNQE